ncbi:hypothetical protein [Bradyrhizobium ottawaense]|uniref:hypothetical protein n=1 Tax=Bradyrhizobium ottawaense TaxID=931866 RepID=UPI0015616BAD|nr:hypothetical protein [Bradyrhizobium ottawaense]
MLFLSRFGGTLAAETGKATALNGLFRCENEGLLFAGEVHRRGVENSRSRNLGSDQEGRHHGRYADEPQKLVNRKHECRPQGASGANSVRPLCRALIGHEKLVGIGRPGNREQRKNRDEGQRFHGASVDFDCGQKRQSSAHFKD